MHGAHAFRRRRLCAAWELDQGFVLAIAAELYGVIGQLDVLVGEGREVIGPEVVAKPVATSEHAATLGWLDARVVRQMERYRANSVVIRWQRPALLAIAIAFGLL